MICRFVAASFSGLGSHIVKGHRMPMADYYLRFVANPCPECGKQIPFSGDSEATLRMTYCGVRCYSMNRPMRLGPNGKGHITSHGYRVVEITKFPDHRSLLENMGMTKRQIFEYRAVMAIKIGRPLNRKESVHHRDGDKLNNAPENLELWRSRHTPGSRVADLICPHCGKAYA